MTLDPSKYRAAREQFEKLAGASWEERRLGLEAISDPSLRDEVERLLRADDLQVELDRLLLQTGTEPMPEFIGSYRVLGEMGRGSMGVVYEAEEASPRRRVALKVTHPWLRSPELLALARREAQAMADLQHPDIPGLYSLFEVDGAPVVAMELVEGVPLSQHALGLAFLPRLELLARVCDAVGYAHQRGIVHRDLKPGNILVTREGQPKLIDFGIASHPDGQPPPGSGTPIYMAPEQVRGTPPQAASDIYALGVVCWEVLTGAPPGPGLPSQSSSLREDVAAVLLRALASSPEARYSQAEDLAEELRRSATNRPVLALRHHPLARLRAHLRRSPGRAAALLGVGILSLFLASQRESLSIWLAERSVTRALTSLRSSWPKERGEVEGSLRSLSEDPRAMGTRALSQGWTWAAGQWEGGARMEALAAAWIYAPAALEAGARDALMKELLAGDDWGAASGLGEAVSQEAGESLALARWDLASSSLSPPTRKYLSGLAQAEETSRTLSQGLLLEGGRRLVGQGALLTLQSPSGQTRSWPMPGAVGGVRSKGEHLLVWGPPGWLLWGEMKDTTLTPISVNAEPSDAVFMEGRGGKDALVTFRYQEAGLYRLQGSALQELHAGTRAQGLPIRSLQVKDLDGNGSPEVILSATGWKGHEVRVLTGSGSDPLAGLQVQGRMCMGARSTAILADASGTRIFALGGPCPEGIAPRSESRLLAQLRWKEGALVSEGVRTLKREAQDIRVADVDGDGKVELLLSHPDQLGILDPEGRGPEVWIPGLGLLDAGQADEDPAAELWVKGRERTFILGTGRGRLPVRETSAREVKVPPSSLHERALREAWSRIGILVAWGRSETVAPRLLELISATGSDATVRAQALELLGSPLQVPGPGVVGFARGLLGQSSLSASTAAAAEEILRQAHVFADAPVPPGSSALVRFHQPLSSAWEVVAPQAVWRNPLSRWLEVEVGAEPTGGTILALSLQPNGQPLCADVELEVVQMDWSSNLELGFRQGKGRTTVTLARVGGGPRTQHQMVLAGPIPGLDVRGESWEGEHRISICQSQNPRTVSFRLDQGARKVVRLPEEPAEGPLSFEIGSPHDVQGREVRLRVRIRGIEFRGASLGAGSGKGERGRLQAERDSRVLEEEVRSGSPWQRVLVLEGLGRVEEASLAGLTPKEMALLLRRSPHTWAGKIRRFLGRKFSAVWLEAWGIPLYYQDPWGMEALLDPALAGLPLDTPASRMLTLLRAKALLTKGENVAADRAIRPLIPLVPEAALLAARLDARLGKSEAARRILRSWLADSPSPEAAQDEVAGDPELSALLPEVKRAPILLAEGQF